MLSACSKIEPFYYEHEVECTKIPLFSQVYKVESFISLW